MIILNFENIFFVISNLDRLICFEVLTLFAPWEKGHTDLERYEGE